MKTLKLTLNNEGSVSHGVISIPHPKHILEVIMPVGTSFHSANTCLVTNHPDGKGNELQKITPAKPYSILEDVIFDIPLSLPGAWQFHLEKSIDENNTQKAETVRFIVDPIITINGKEIPPSGLVVQTNFGRCIGYLKDWVKNLKPIAELGYNMIHLPPFQEVGSYSHYSVADHLQVSKYLFPPEFPAKDRSNVLKTEFKRIEKELGIVFMADVVLNHMSPDSPWLKNHPNAGYNLDNSPHLQSAFYVDQVLDDLSLKIAKGQVDGLPPDLQVSHMKRLIEYLTDGLRKSGLKKFFTIDPEQALNDLQEASKNALPKNFEMLRMRAVNYGAPQRLNILRNRGIIMGAKTNYAGPRIDPNYAAALYRTPGQFNDQRLDEFKMALNTINAPFLQHYESVLKEIVTNVVNSFQYNRYDPNGPKLGPVTAETPVAWRYFSVIKTKDGKDVPLANNGWIMGGNPTTDFIAPGYECYVRRQVVIWGDNIKINYGEKREDNPEVWDYMKQYICSVAEVCHSIRLDNAHSTKLSVAEYFIKQARLVNPNLYIMAELFTGSEDEDIHYINHIGINSFMREGRNFLSPGGMTHLLWSSGGRSVAAVDALNSDEVIRPVRQIPGVIFDITHDNALPSFDRLTVSTVYTMTCSPFGSTRGYDEILNLNPPVTDMRKYPISTNGLQKVRAVLNKIHTEMAVGEMNEIMAHYYGNLVSIFRCNSRTGEGVWTLVRVQDGDTTVDTVAIPSPIDSLVVESRILDTKFVDSDGTYKDSEKTLKAGSCQLFFNTETSKMKSCRIDDPNLRLVDFPVGSIIIFKTKLSPELTQFLTTFDLDSIVSTFRQRLRSIGLIELAILLFRCSAEEHVTLTHGAYGFPEMGECFYAGTQGVETAFKFAANSPEGMGHPVFGNVRDGNWLIDFMSNRLFQSPRLIPLEGIFRGICEKLEMLPRYLIPKNLDRIVRAMNIAARERIVNQLSPFVKKGDDLVQSLATTSISFYTPISNAQLVHPRRAKIFNNLLTRTDTCMSAGFPHFATGFMRSWGRDTFISLRGIFLVTGRFTEARDQLIAFAACLRHGLIPNLHDGGLNPRYNARDATWWFLQALQDYAIMSGEGGEVFKLKVPRLFPTDDQTEFLRRWESRGDRPIVAMADIVQEIMTKHANGIHFTEWNAGQKIDSVMKSEGFNINIVTDWTNGFILGGNAHNAGTWMDKMGSCTKAKNSGIPATPRDGAAVEIIGLLQSTLRWLDASYAQKSYPYSGIKIASTGAEYSWSQWSNLILNSFETWFYIPTNPAKDLSYFIEQNNDSPLVGIRGIYKDTVGSSQEFADYQFRPNLLVAMTVAPELFDPVHAVRCLNLVEDRLMGHIGMRTLDPSDFRYRPYYNNSEESEEFLTSHGFNYHNGPEWVWPTGYFFRASMRFRRGITEKMKQMLANIKRTQLESWANGLPELTNKDGAVCYDSCTNQAWSIAAILEVLYDYSMYTDEEVIMWEVDEDEDEEEEDI